MKADAVIYCSCANTRWCPEGSWRRLLLRVVAVAATSRQQRSLLAMGSESGDFEALTALIAATIIVVNMFLKTLIVVLVRFEKHNTFFRRWSYYWEIIRRSFHSILESLSCWWMAISRASTSARSSMDLIAKWIRYVSVMSTMALNVNNPHVMPVIQIPVSAIKRFCRRNKMRTQKDLIEPYSGPSSNRFAAVLNTMIVSVLYSSGISLMLFTCSLTLMFTRVFDKIALLRLYRYPPMMDQTLGEYAVSIMKWAVFVHCAMALWIYSYPATLSSETPMPQNRMTNLGSG